jgi:hypothetical protein
MSNLATIVNNILADSGIDDINVVVTTGSYSNPAWITALSWTKITDRPTTLAGYGITDAVPSSRTITINGTAQDLSANRTFNVGTVTSVAALTLGTSGTDLSSTVANGTTTPVITLNVPTASAANRGALSAADWTTFNNKQNALTNPVTGTGTTGQVAYWSSGSAITGEANLFWDATNDRLGIGTATPLSFLDISSGTNTDIIRFGASSRWGFRRENNDNRYVAFYRGLSSTPSAVWTVDGDNGNLGLGVTPSAWGGNNKAIEGAYGTSYSFDLNVPIAHISSNAFNNGTNWIYKINAPASRYVVVGWTGEHIWYNAPSGTAGNAISFTQAMTLDASGNLLVGAVSNIGSTRREIVMRGANGSVISLGNNTTADRFQIVSDSGENALLNNKANTPMIFYTSNAEAMRIFSDGNVFIGSSPSNVGFKLDVNGTGRFNSTSSTPFLINTNTDNTTTIRTSNGGGNAYISFENSGDANNAFAIGRSNSGDFVLNHSASSVYGGGTLTNYLNIASTGAATFSSSVTAAFLRITDSAGEIGEINSTNANGGYITWRTSGTTIADLGTAQQIFGAGGNNTFGINARGARSLILGTNNTARFTIDSTGAATFSSSVTATNAIISGASSRIRLTDTNITNASFNTLLFEASAQNKFSLGVNSTTSQNYAITIDGTNQNVGIGTTSPSVKLDVNGKIYSSTEVQANNAVINTTSGYATFGSNSSAVGLRVGRDAFFDDIIINTGGNVSIGTTSDPGFKLNVNGTGRFSGRLLINSTTNYSALQNTNTSGNIYWGIDNSTGSDFTGVSYARFIYSEGAYPLITYVNGAERMRIASTGAATFSSSVTAGGSFISSMGNNAVIFSSTAATTGHQTMSLANSGAQLVMGINNSTGSFGTNSIAYASFITTGLGSTPLQLGTNSTMRMTITAGGDVGIGTNSPTAALDVNGNGNTLVGNFNYSSNGTYVRWQNNGTSFGDIGSGSSLVSGGATNDFAIHARSTFNMVFSTNFTERMRIFSGGNVHVGPTPGSDNGAMLQVSGTTRLSGRVGVNTATVSGIQLLVQGENNGAVDFGLVVRNSSSANLFSVRNDGLVSTGTAGSILTGAPFGTTVLPWRLGRFLTETASVNGSIRVQIGTRYYNIAAQDLGEVPS